MPRFEPIVRTVTISREDMTHLLNMPLEEMNDWSPVDVRLFETWPETMQAMARIMVDCIKANNAAGRITTLILPVGPTQQYPIAAEMSNREGVSWERVWTFNMDEYLDWQGRPIPADHPMSFRGAMQRDLFDRLDPALRIPEEQHWFPDPMNPDAIDAKIDELTGGAGVDICFGGIGEHGHIAFNEAPDLISHYAHITPDEFKHSKTRALTLSPETLVRALGNVRYTLCPPGAVTLGMRVLLEARRIVLSTAGDNPVSRIAAMHPPSMDYPVTYIHEHADPKETVTLLVGRTRR